MMGKDTAFKNILINNVNGSIIRELEDSRDSDTFFHRKASKATDLQHKLMFDIQTSI